MFNGILYLEDLNSILTSEKPHQCCYYENGIISKYVLGSHKGVNNWEKTYQCNIFGKYIKHTNYDKWVADSSLYYYNYFKNYIMHMGNIQYKVQLYTDICTSTINMIFRIGISNYNLLYDGRS